MRGEAAWLKIAQVSESVAPGLERERKEVLTMEKTTQLIRLLQWFSLVFLSMPLIRIAERIMDGTSGADRSSLGTIMLAIGSTALLIHQILKRMNDRLSVLENKAGVSSPESPVKEFAVIPVAPKASS